MVTKTTTLNAEPISSTKVTLLQSKLEKYKYHYIFRIVSAIQAIVCVLFGMITMHYTKDDIVFTR